MPTTEELAPETDEADGSGDESSGSGNAGGGASGGSRGPSARRESRTKADLTDRATEQAAKLAGPEAAAAVKTVNKLERKSKTLRTVIRIGRAVGGLGPVGTAILVVGIVVFLLIIIVLMATPGGALEQNQNGPKLSITKSGPTQAREGDILNYTIAVGFPGTAQDIQIVDRLPAGTQYESASPSAKYDEAARTVTWNIKDIIPPVNGLLQNVNTSLSLTLKATINNDFVVNQAEGMTIGEVRQQPNPDGGGGGPITEGYIPPNDNDCGKYASVISKNRFLPKNFGDPDCSYDKEKVNNLLREKDGPNADWWFLVIACESGYNPNAWLDPDTNVGGYRSPDAGGAWGLFQNGSSADFPSRLYGSTRKESVRLEEAIELPGRPPPAVGHSKDPNDRGDLNWFIQIENAIKLLPARGKGYWACA